MIIVSYVLFGGFAGYVSARIYKMCGGQAWRQNVLLTSFLVPGCIFGLLIIINFFLIGQRSSGALPFGTLFSLLLLWFFLSIPLCFIGSFMGFKTEVLWFNKKIQVPVRTLQIPRQIPAQPLYLQFIPAILLAGVLPFGALFIELMYVMNSIWGARIYYVFGFLMVVFSILVITTSLVSILVCYFALCSENYHWWWRSFFSGASCGFYVFLYGIVYYSTKLELRDAISTIVFFGWTAAMSAGIGLMGGTAAFISCLLFIRKIYNAIKID